MSGDPGWHLDLTLRLGDLLVAVSIAIGLPMMRALFHTLWQMRDDVHDLKKDLVTTLGRLDAVEKETSRNSRWLIAKGLRDPRDRT